MKLIRKKASEVSSGQSRFTGEAIDRRTFLRRSGLALGGAAVATTLPPIVSPLRRERFCPPTTVGIPPAPI